MFKSNSLFQRLLLRNLNKRLNLSRSIRIKILMKDRIFNTIFWFILFVSNAPSQSLNCTSKWWWWGGGGNTKDWGGFLRLCMREEGAGARSITLGATRGGQARREPFFFFFFSFYVLL